MKTKIFIILLMIAGVCTTRVSAQEIFFSNDGKLSALTPSHFYLTAQEDYSDYITKDATKAMKVSGSSTLLRLSRFYENSTIGFQGQTGILQIPKVVINEALYTPTKGLTISGWLKVEDYSSGISIGFFGKDISNANGVKIDIAMINKKIIIRKKSRLKASTISPIITTDFTVDYDGTEPVGGDLTNGYFYFCIASDNQTCRVTMSRPGGRLFTRLYYVSLTDILTMDDSFFWGRSPASPNSVMNIPNAFDDVMVYNKYLSAEENLNAFYIQSPLYPGVSYLFEAPDGYTPAPENNRNDTQVFNSDYFKWFNNLNYTGPFSCNRWFFREVNKPTATSDTRMYFSNARSGGNIYQPNSSYFLYQLLTPSKDYPLRTQYAIKRDIYPANLYDPNPKTGYNIGTYWFTSINAPDYTLGWANADMYLLHPTEASAWRVKGAKKVYQGAETQLSLSDASKMYVMIKNHYLNKYMDIYFGGKYYYLILNDRDLNSNNQKFLIKPNSSSDSGIYKMFDIKSISGDRISAYWGETDQKDDEHIIIHSQPFGWELVYVKDDANNKPLYAIRANNGYGSYLLGYKDVLGTNPHYACQASAGAYTADGSVKDNFLWSIEVHAGTNTNGIQTQSITTGYEIAKKESSYSIYPNPVKDQFKLSSVDIMNNTKVVIYDLSGSPIITKEIQNEKEHIFNLSAYPTGVYTMIITSPEKKKEIKIIKH